MSTKNFRNVALTAVFSILVLQFDCLAEIPAGYYDGINGLKDSALKTKLHSIVKNHKTNDYSGLFRYSFIYTDVRDDGSWWDMYSDVKRYVRDNHANTPSGMNREHCLPKSWWGGDENDAYTDLNHLYPSDASANTAKLHWPLGEVDNATFNNGISKVGSPVRGQGGGAGTVFEPYDEYKGDFARTYFYMATCYQDFNWKYTYMTQDGAYPSLKQWAIDLLLKWHREDPVSEKEKERNDQVYLLQYNRNPYIDYPELVEYIWGTMVGKPYSQGELPPTGEGTLTSPINNSTVEFGNVIAGKSKTTNIPIRGKVTENLSVSLSGTDRTEFSIPTGSIAWKDINEGTYELAITYNPTSADGNDDNATLLLFDGGLQGITCYTINLKGSPKAMPVFDKPVATDATEITATGFRANWQIPANPSEIDYYVVNLIEYDNGSRRDFSITTDGNTNYLDFMEAVPGAIYRYTVQSSLYGELSPESNSISVEMSGINEIEVRSMQIVSVENGIRFSCDRTQTNVKVTDISGRIAATAAQIDDGDTIILSPGIYIVYSNEMLHPTKVVVR